MLTSQQLTTLNTSLLANTNTILISGEATVINTLTTAQQANSAVQQAVANWYNLSTTAFWVWQPISSLAATGMAIKMSDVGNLTTANATRLSTSFQLRPNGFLPSVQDDRSLFGGLFSVAGAAGTLINLLAAWQRLATNAEQLFATGTGTEGSGLNTDGSLTTGSPATLSFSGSLSGLDIQAAYLGHY